MNAKTLAEQVAERVAPTIRAAFDAAGQPVTWETVLPVLQALKHQLGVLSPDEDRAAAIAAREAWAKAEGLRTDSEMRRDLRLSATEWQTALRLNLIRPVPVPVPYRMRGDIDDTHSGDWYPALDLTEAQRAEIAGNTLVRANEAAPRWGMSLPRFRKEWRKRGLEPVREDPHPWFLLSDVLRLAPKD